MARERNGFITMKPEDFVEVTGAPYYPARIMGQEGEHLVATHHWHVVIDGQPWMMFGYNMGRIRYVGGLRDKFNAGIDLDRELQGARFAVGPAYYWNSSVNGMRRMSGEDFPYAVWINRLPNFESGEVVEVREVHS